MQPTQFFLNFQFVDQVATGLLVDSYEDGLKVIDQFQTGHKRIAGSSRGFPWVVNAENLLYVHLMDFNDFMKAQQQMMQQAQQQQQARSSHNPNIGPRGYLSGN